MCTHYTKCGRGPRGEWTSGPVPCTVFIHNSVARAVPEALADSPPSSQSCDYDIQKDFKTVAERKRPPV